MPFPLYKYRKAFTDSRINESEMVQANFFFCAKWNLSAQLPVEDIFLQYYLGY